MSAYSGRIPTQWQKTATEIVWAWIVDQMLGGQPGEPSVHFDLLSSGSLVAPSGSLVAPSGSLVVP